MTLRREINLLVGLAQTDFGSKHTLSKACFLGWLLSGGYLSVLWPNFNLIYVGFGPNETYADAGFLGWKFPVEINLCGEELPQTDFCFETDAN